MLYFALCQGDLLLTTDNAIPYDLSNVIELHPWHKQIKFSTPSGIDCVAVKLEYPVCKDGYKMMGLRETFEVLDGEHYALAGKARELLYWNDNSQYCGVCGSPMQFHTNISTIRPLLSPITTLQDSAGLQSAQCLTHRLLDRNRRRLLQ